MMSIFLVLEHISSMLNTVSVSQYSVYKEKKISYKGSISLVVVYQCDTFLWVVLSLAIVVCLLSKGGTLID